MNEQDSWGNHQLGAASHAVRSVHFFDGGIHMTSNEVVRGDSYQRQFLTAMAAVPLLWLSASIVSAADVSSLTASTGFSQSSRCKARRDASRA